MHAFRKLQACCVIGVKSSEEALTLEQLDRPDSIVLFHNMNSLHARTNMGA